MKLKLRKTLKIRPTKPFSFDTTFYKPDHFASDDHIWSSGIRWQTWNWKEKCLGVKFSNRGTAGEPLVEIKIYAKNKLSNEFITSLVEEIKYRYNLDLDLTDFYKKFSKDDVFAPIIKRMRGMRPGHPNSLYEYLIIGIVLQNAPVRRSIQMLKVLLEEYGTLVEFDNKKLWCFWAPGKLKRTAIDDLRALKVGYRAKSIKKIDDAFSEKLINEYKLRREDIDIQTKELLKLYGVGPATVWYLLFDIFHNWDFFNHISPWEQKIYSKIFFDRDTNDPVSVKRLLKYFEKYGKYRQIAVHYAWEDLWWRHNKKSIPWLKKEIRL